MQMYGDFTAALGTVMGHVRFIYWLILTLVRELTGQAPILAFHGLCVPNAIM